MIYENVVGLGIAIHKTLYLALRHLSKQFFYLLTLYLERLDLTTLLPKIEVCSIFI